MILRAALSVRFHPRLAFEQSFPPGSTIKPFTLLSAARSGAINAESRKCSGGISRLSMRSNVPSRVFDRLGLLTLACCAADYFAHLGERLSEISATSKLDSTSHRSNTTKTSGSPVVIGDRVRLLAKVTAARDPNSACCLLGYV
jgi:hypothetical protein